MVAQTAFQSDPASRAETGERAASTSLARFLVALDASDHANRALAEAVRLAGTADGTIAVQTLRGGDSPGDHTVLFIVTGERLELVHRAATREHFAEGAVRAASGLVVRAPDLDRIEEIFGLEG